MILKFYLQIPKEMIQQAKLETWLIDQCSSSHPSIIISKLIGASGFNEHKLKFVNFNCQLRKYKDKENDYIQRNSRLQRYRDVWLRHWGSDFRVLEVESHEGSNLKGEDVRVVGGK